jgi:hypothetical protein
MRSCRLIFPDRAFVTALIPGSEIFSSVSSYNYQSKTKSPYSIQRIGVKSYGKRNNIAAAGLLTMV